MAFPASGRTRSRVLQAETQHLVHLFLLDGLREIVLRTQAHRLRHFAGVANAGDHHDFAKRTCFTYSLQRFQSIPAGQDQIEKHQVRSLLPHLLQRFLAAGGGAYLIGIEFQGSLQILPHAGLVVDDQYVAGAHWVSHLRC